MKVKNMQNTLKYKIQDRTIYYDMSGLQLNTGDFILCLHYKPLPLFGICEYAKFCVSYFNIETPEKPSKEKNQNGLIIHMANKVSKSIETFPCFEDFSKNIAKSFEVKSKSDYSEEFSCDIYFDETMADKEIILPVVKLKPENIKDRFLSKDYDLFLKVQEKIINTSDKIYHHYEIERNSNYAR